MAATKAYGAARGVAARRNGESSARRQHQLSIAVAEMAMSLFIDNLAGIYGISNRRNGG